MNLVRPSALLRALLTLAIAAIFSTPAPAVEVVPSSSAKPVMLLVHGAWGGAWQFSKIDPLLREHGFDVRRVTLTGLGERGHLATRDIGLETHIQDVMNVILFERLENVILVGHSYGGMVITGVADRLPERIARLVYLDAFLPNDEERLVNLRRPELAARIDQMAKDGFLIPSWVTPDKPFPKDVPHPVKTTTDRLILRNQAATAKIPGTYILTVEPGARPEDDDFYLSAERARARGWTVHLMEADHNPQWRKPSETAQLLNSLR